MWEIYQITFHVTNFACKCGCGFDSVDYELLVALEAIREHFDRAVTLNSGCRCRDHNTAVGGSDGSQHLLGRAANIVVEETPPPIVAEFAEQLDLGGVGAYDTFTHIDTRVGFARW